MASRRRSQEQRVHGDVPGTGSGIWAAIYDLVRSIPRGRVMTYGQIAELCGQLVSPRAVGWAMHTCPDDVPWHRVVNARGACSTERLADLPPHVQQEMLEAEGVEFQLDRTLDLGRYRWAPRGRFPVA
ncbi:MAG: MGMT family protein [Thermoanaerobaculaceae bacterium]|nr:MGMT family protein [Thermoanaerobaculaceae bacterium]MDI9622364.1 MGMT family protein [Acidobacteriota bacterium]NLH10734.1 methyltransferase [Holophagae bacterium]HPW56586.1 MGMT family protein [Thermoanaerobaculaceae bacterium]